MTRFAATAPAAPMSLWHWRRSIADLYHDVRRLPARSGWDAWIASRRELMRHHPQSPFMVGTEMPALEFYPYDPEARIFATVRPVPTSSLEIAHNTGAPTAAHAFGAVDFAYRGTRCSLTLYWLDDYAGGVFLPFRDRTNGQATYAGGRYLLDTAKGADLGGDDGEVILDFNFSYHPSCAYADVWSCPLAPRDNHLPVAIEAGERLR